MVTEHVSMVFLRLSSSTTSFERKLNVSFEVSWELHFLDCCRSHCFFLNYYQTWYLLHSAPYLHQIWFNLEKFGWIFLPTWRLQFWVCIFFSISKYYVGTAGKMYCSTVMVFFFKSDFLFYSLHSGLRPWDFKLQTPDSRLQTPTYIIN